MPVASANSALPTMSAMPPGESKTVSKRDLYSHLGFGGVAGLDLARSWCRKSETAQGSDGDELDEEHFDELGKRMV